MPDLFETLSEQQVQTVERLAKKVLLEGASLGTIKGYSSDELEAVYHFAHNAYQQRKYEDAVTLFLFLTESDHAESRYWMGLAAAYQMSKQYHKALVAYGMTALLDATNPWPPIHVCECYLAMDDRSNAREALDAAEGVCEATDDEQSNEAARARVAKLELRLAQSEPPLDTGSAQRPAEPSASPVRGAPHPGGRRTRRRI